MFAIFLTAAYAPFTVAFFVMIGLGLIEALGLGWGHFDGQDGLGGDTETGHWLGWLGIGEELPLLIWLTSLLGCFTLTGIGLQQLATAVWDAPLAWPWAAGGALVLGLVLNGFAATALARILPGYESTVISTSELVMRRGTILEGTASRGHPARAKVVDLHQQAHYVMVEPQYDGDIITQGQTALLVRREGTTFFGVPDVPPPLTAL